MKALRFKAYGSPGVLGVEQMAIPLAGPDEVIVKVAAAAINPSDVKNVAGMFGATLPRTPGRDYAGTVVSEGPWHGCAVWGSGAGFGVSRDGAQAEYLRLPASWLSAKPGNITMAQAATVGVPYVTAWTALVRAGDLQPGETLLVTGSTGAVGRAAIQIARWRGACVIGVGVSDLPSEADIYLNASTQDVLAAVAARTGGRGVDIVLDAVGGSMFETSLRTLCNGGRQIAITSMDGNRVEFDLRDFYHRQLRLIGVDTMKLGGAEIAAILDVLRPGFEAGKLLPPEIRRWALEEAAEAYQALSARPASKRHVFGFE